MFLQIEPGKGSKIRLIAYENRGTIGIQRKWGDDACELNPVFITRAGSTTPMCEGPYIRP
jgi:hypothetical protein